MHIAALILALLSGLLWFIPAPLDAGWWIVPVAVSLIAMGLAVAAIKRNKGRPVAISALVVAVLVGLAVPLWMLPSDEPEPVSPDEEVVVVDSPDPGTTP